MTTAASGTDHQSVSEYRTVGTADRLQLVLIGLVVCGFMYAYGAHMNRMIVFDEIGLHNPVYTYATTGRMTYPMHGHPEYMVVHPPTHYLATAMLTKLGVPMFTASALPLLFWTVVLVAVIVTGPFSVATSAGLIFGYFVAVTTWGEFYTLRPDLHVTTAWFVGLVTLEAARVSGWSSWRLFLGSALMVLAATVHYWGITALLGPLCYGAVLVRERGVRASLRPIAGIAAGGLVVGLPFLILFVLPLFEPMMQMVRAVQGDGTPADAFARHLASYEVFARRTSTDWSLRPIVAALAGPILDLRIPAVFVACPLLCVWRETRVLGLVGSILPLFVLFGSQGKQIEYTGYFMPEFALYFVAVLILAIKCANRLRPRRLSRTFWQTAALAIVAVFVFAAVPRSMGYGRSWTNRLDTLDVIRAASKRVVGEKAAVAVTSAGVWYTGGATYLWNGFNEIIRANRDHADIRNVFSSFDGILIDTNWWNALPSLAPTPTWFAQGELSLKGFVLPTDPTARHMMHLFVTAADRTPVRGFFIDREEIREFREASGGESAFSVLRCDALPSTAFNQAWYQFSFAYDRQPAPNAPVLLLLASPAEAAAKVLAEAGPGCRVVDSRLGTLRTMSRVGFADTLINEVPIRFFEQRHEVLQASGRISREVLRGVSWAVDWDRAHLVPPSTRTATTGLLHVVPPTQAWAYGAVLPLEPQGEIGGTIVKITADVLKGQVGFGVLNRSQTDFEVRGFRNQNAATQDIELRIPDAVTSVGPLVIQNGERDRGAEVVVKRIEFQRPVPSGQP